MSVSCLILKNLLSLRFRWQQTYNIKKPRLKQSIPPQLRTSIQIKIGFPKIEIVLWINVIGLQRCFQCSLFVPLPLCLFFEFATVRCIAKMFANINENRRNNTQQFRKINSKTITFDKPIPNAAV